MSHFKYQQPKICPRSLVQYKRSTELIQKLTKTWWNSGGCCARMISFNILSLWKGDKRIGESSNKGEEKTNSVMFLHTRTQSNTCSRVFTFCQLSRAGAWEKQGCVVCFCTTDCCFSPFLLHSTCSDWVTLASALTASVCECAWLWSYTRVCTHSDSEDTGLLGE